MDPINTTTHLFPQIMAALAFGIALVPVTILVIADNVATTGQLAAALRVADADRLALRIAHATAIPLTDVVGLLVRPGEFVRIVRDGTPLDFRAGGIPVRTPRPTRERARA